MAAIIRRVLPALLRLARCGALGFMCGAVVGALFVLVGWFPSALAMNADDPTFLIQSLLAWCAAWAVVCGALGLVVGVVVSVLIDVGDRLADRPPRADKSSTIVHVATQPRVPASDRPAGMPPR